jgi:hypothetical protein
MATVKLTTWMREAIVARMLAHRFKGVWDGLVKEGAALALDTYNDVYDEATRRKINGLPDGWLGERNEFNVQFGIRGSNCNGLEFDGTWITCNTNAYCLRPRNWTGKKVTRRFLHKDNHKALKYFEKDNPLSVRYFDILKRAGEQAELHEKARKMGMQACHSVTTLKRLQEVWPECWPFAKEYESDGTTGSPGLPVPIIADLNSIFKLPVEGRVHV